MAINPMMLLAIGALAAGGVGAAGALGAGGAGAAGAEAAAAGAAGTEAATAGAVGAETAAAETAAAAAPAAETAGAAEALGATEMAPEAVAAAEGGEASFMDKLILKLGGGNPKLGQMALAGMAVQAGAALAGPDSAVGRVGGAVGKGFQGAMMAESAKAAREKNRKLIDSILGGITAPGTAGHDEFKASSDGTYTVKGQFEQFPSTFGGSEEATTPPLAPAQTSAAPSNAQIASLSPWADKIVG